MPVRIDKAGQALNDVLEEFNRANDRFGPMRSAHEGFAILHEEEDELWDEVKKNPSTRDPLKMRAEACQVAAMALRFMVDCCPAPAAGADGCGENGGKTGTPGTETPRTPDKCPSPESPSDTPRTSP